MNMNVNEADGIEVLPNEDLMTRENYHAYCCAWCVVIDSSADCYPEYQYAGAAGIVFG